MESVISPFFKEPEPINSPHHCTEEYDEISGERLRLFKLVFPDGKEVQEYGSLEGVVAHVSQHLVIFLGKKYVHYVMEGQFELYAINEQTTSRERVVLSEAQEVALLEEYHSWLNSKNRHPLPSIS